MPRVFVGIGSNVDREHNIRAGIRALRGVFGALTLSPVYEARPVGFDGQNFYNLVAAFDTDLEADAVVRELQDIERRFGRGEGAAKLSPRTLDLDLLTYGDLCRYSGAVKVPREDIDKYAFVLWPLAEIAADLRHPATGERFCDLRAGFRGAREELWRVDLDLGQHD